MPIHEKDTVRDELLDDIYASHDLSLVMPKYKFPKAEQEEMKSRTVDWEGVLQ